jgi:hypothetical protein
MTARTPGPSHQRPALPYEGWLGLLSALQQTAQVLQTAPTSPRPSAGQAPAQTGG